MREVSRTSPAQTLANVRSRVWDKTFSRYRIALLLVTLAVIAPVWIVDYPGMVDYPNHLARCYVLAHYHVNPVWQARYLVDRSLLPNLAIDLIVVPLNHFLPILVSGKIFLTLTALLYVIGCVWTGYAVTGKRSWLALIAALTLYNSTFLFGFVNYDFGISVFLCAFAFWLQSRLRMTWLRFAICCLFSFAAFLSHLSAIVILGVSCTTIALLEFRTHRRVLNLFWQLAWLAFPVLVMTIFMRSSGRVGVVEWSTARDKFVHIFIPLRSYSLTLDAIVGILLFGCTFVLTRKCKVHSVIFVALVLFVLFAVSPDGLFQSSAVDARYVLPAALLAFLSIEPLWERPQRLAFGVALLALFVHTVEIASNWVSINRRERQVLAMGTILPQNARVFIVPHLAMREPPKTDRGFYNLVTFWTVSRQADVSALFSTPGMQPLVARQPPPCDTHHWIACVPYYDYAWTDDPLPETASALQSMADPVESWGAVTLWRVRRPPQLISEPAG